MRRMTPHGRGRIGLLALLVVGALASLLATASLASAAPELGRCVQVEGKLEGKKTVFNGGYKSKNCRHSSPTKTGKFEWLPGPGEEKTFESGQEGSALLETTSGIKITCPTAQKFGEFTGATTEKLKFVMAGCEEVATKAICTTEVPEEEELPIEGIIRSNKLTGELGLVEGEKKVGWQVKPEAGSVIASFECGAKLTGKQYVLEGSYTNRIRRTNKMTEETFEVYKQSGGLQKPSGFTGGPATNMSAKYLSGLELITEPIGLQVLEEAFFEEELEYRVSSS